MKKSLLLLLFTLLLFCLQNNVSAENSYTAFQEITLERGKMLADFTEEEYDKYYEKVNKRCFWGWRTYYVNENIKAKYISETIFSYYNNGTSSITYTYNLTKSETAKLSISGTGSISYSLNGTKKTFKNGLSAALKLEADYSKTSQTSEASSFKLVIEPNTVANLRIVGEGKLSNGVASKYIFWIRNSIGGFEYFIVTTEYPRLEVLPI